MCMSKQLKQTCACVETAEANLQVETAEAHLRIGTAEANLARSEQHLSTADTIRGSVSFDAVMHFLEWSGRQRLPCSLVGWHQTTAQSAHFTEDDATAKGASLQSQDSENAFASMRDIKGRML